MSVEIEVAGIELVARHGVHEEERRAGQRFRVDLAVRVSDPGGDELADTIDYRELAESVRRWIESARPRRLLETLAADAARDVLERFPTAERVCVSIAKPDVELAGGARPRVSAEVVRSRS